MELFKKLKEDPELFMGYQANIAMAFVDEYNKEWEELNEFKEGVPERPDIHKIANNAAINFLNLLIN